MAAPNQGIMALPENQGMQAPQLSLSDSYEAMEQGLMQARPDAYMEMQEALAEIRPALEELTDEQLALLIQAIQGLYGDPENYQARVQELVKNQFIEDAEELPPEYNEEFIATLLMILIDIQRTRQGAVAPMPQAEAGMPANLMPPPQQFARGGIAEAARLVAQQGRYGDTMLAHITPEEARLLKARGGSGTINPQTGLPEFWPLLSRKRGIGKVITKALSSPIGRILGTIALGMVIGPAVGALLPSLSATAAAGLTGALSSGIVTAAAGGDLKSILTSAAVGFLGAPGGPVSTFVGKYTAQIGITNPIVNAALTGAVVGTGTGLVSGQSLKESVKSGLVEGAISGGMAYFSGAPKVDVDNAARTAAEKATTSGTKLPPLESANIDDLSRKVVLDETIVEDFLGTGQKGAGAQRRPAGPAGSQYVLGPDGMTFIDVTTGQPVSTADAARMRLDPTLSRRPTLGEGVAQAQASGMNAPQGLPIPSMDAAPNRGIFATRPELPFEQGTAIREAAARAAESGTTVGGLPQAPAIGELATGSAGVQPTQPYVYPEFNASLKKALTPGTMMEGMGDLFFPSAPTVEQVLDSPVYKNLIERGASPTAALDAATKKMTPGMWRTYGPAVGAGVGALALAGGFKPPPPPEDRSELYGTPGLDLIKASPSTYLVQGLPGVKYDSRGNILGSEASYSPSYTMEDIRVPSMYANGGIAALAQGGYPRRIGQISGPGTEKSDSIPAMLSDGEFVMTAKAVRGAGGGNRREGAKRMYALMHQLERNAARG